MLKLEALNFYIIVDDNPNGMEWDAIVQKLNTKYQSIGSEKLWIPKATNTKANSKKLAGLRVKVNKLTSQVGAQDPRGS